MILALFILLPTISWAFLPLTSVSPSTQHFVSLRAGDSNTYEDIISRLRREYHDLQDELFVYLIHNDKDSASDLSQEMLANAANLNMAERYNQVLKVKQTEDRLKHAKKDLEFAREIVSEAHNDALVADFKTHHVDSMDQIFDAAKRQSAVRAAEEAHDAEEFAKDMLVDMQFEQLQAEVEYDSAEALLQDLMENSKLLERSLNQMKYEHHLAEHWAQREMPKHKDFLSTARRVVRSGKLIDHDPQRGNVAF